MPKTLIIITSYERKDMLCKLLDSLYKQGQSKDDIIVFDDGSKFDYSDIECEFFRYSANFGKMGAWLKFRSIFSKTRKGYDYYILLPDDIDIVDNFVEKCINKFELIKDDKKICLSLLTNERCLVPNWTGFNPIVKEDVILTQWNDLCFISKYDFFDRVYIKPIHEHRWKYNKLLGSGVGQVISQYLYNKGLNMYHVRDSLVIHGEHESKMNKEAAKLRKW